CRSDRSARPGPGVWTDYEPSSRRDRISGGRRTDMDRNRSIGENVDDSRLMQRLGVMFDHIDPVPPSVTAGARQAFAWRDFDAAVAELIEAESLAGSSELGD